MSASTVLTAKQARFIDEYLVDANGTQASIRAGYGAAGARVAAHRLLTNVAISSAIEARRQADSARLALTRQNVLQQLMDAFGLAREMGQPAAMVAAARELGRLMGFYAPGKVESIVSRANAFEKEYVQRLTDDELMSMISLAEAALIKPSGLKDHF